jgi:recombination protein RecA
MPVNEEYASELVTAIEKTYGKGTFHKGAESKRVTRIPTGSFELDYATGGGIPMGRITSFWGNYSSGKTLTLLNVMKNAQNIHIFGDMMAQSKVEGIRSQGEQILETFPDGMTIVYYNIEMVWDKDFAERVGVDTDKVYIVETSRIEEVGEIASSLLGAYHLHCIDSVSEGTSLDELNSDISDWHMGIKTRVWNKALDHMKDKMDLYENSILFTRQVTTDIRTGSMQPKGGNKMDHTIGMQIQFKRGGWLFDRDGELKPEAEKSPNTLSGKAEADGFEIMARVDKSRVGRPFRTAHMQINLNNMGVDHNYELAKAAIFFKVVEKSGSWFKLPEGIEYDGKNSIQGKAKLAKVIKENVEFKNKIMNIMYEYMWENP